MQLNNTFLKLDLLLFSPYYYLFQPGTIIDIINQASHYGDDDTHRLTEIVGFAVAGSETISQALAWILFELSKNPDEAEKVRNALLDTPESERATCSALRNLVKEVMRLHPPAALSVVRVLGREFQTDDGCILPKGTIAFLPHTLANRFPKVYGQNADEFRPDRWNDADEKMKTAFAPFASGQRNCIGQGLATTEIHTFLAILLPKYKFEFVKDFTPTMLIAYHPMDGLLKVSKW